MPNISLGDNVSNLLESHPDHRYGKCDDLYFRIINEFVNSPQFKLDIASRKVEWLESRNAGLSTQVAALQEQLRKRTEESISWMRKALQLQFPPKPVAPTQPSASEQPAA